MFALQWFFCFSFALFLLPSLVSSQTLVLIGGGLSDDNAIIYNKIIELAGGVKNARIGVLTMAADNPTTEGEKFVSVFRDIYGANATWIPIVQDNNSSSSNDPANVKMIDDSTGLFFCGGTRNRVIRALRRGNVDSLAMIAIRLLLKRGGVLSGSSAGMASQSSRTVLITGSTYPDAVALKNYTTAPGGLFTFPGNYILDAHCSEYGREGRMIRILWDTKDAPDIGTPRGFSVDEDHALVVTDLYTSPIGTVIGSRYGVHFFDVSNTVSSPSSTTDLKGVLTSYYSVDDVIDLTTGKATIASWKKRIISPTYPNAIPSADIFSISKPGQWRETANILIDNQNDYTVRSISSTETNFEVLLNATSAVAYGGTTADGTRVYSFEGMIVNLRGI